jgi:DNA-binding FadR family transcriptional regulator
MSDMVIKTLSEKTAENLMGLIREQGYATGEKLPNEYELSSMLGVSRNTVREAIRMLASRNIVVIRQGAGTFIAQNQGIIDDPLGFSFVEDRFKLTADLLQIRCIIEPQIASLAAQNATEEDLEILESSYREVEDLLVKRKSFSEKDMEFHTQIANCSHNNVMSKLIPVIAAGVTVFSWMLSEEYEQTIKAHRKIFEAIKAGRAVEAQQAMLFHLLYNQNRLYEEPVQK